MTELTFAELAFLLADQETALARLQLHRWGQETAVAASGMASLLTRRLLIQVNDELHAADELISALECIASPTQWLSIGSARGGDHAEIHIFESGSSRVAVSVLSYGAFEVRQMDAAVPLARSVDEIVRAFVDSPDAGAIFLSRDPHDPDTGLALRRSPTGALEAAAGSVETAPIQTIEPSDSSSLIESFLT